MSDLHNNNLPIFIQCTNSIDTYIYIEYQNIYGTLNGTQNLCVDHIIKTTSFSFKYTH